MGEAGLERVCVCAITLARPEGLARMLASVFAQRCEGIELCVAVVENDGSGAMREVVAEAARRAGFDGGRVAFGTEGRRGIPFARNAALRLAEERFSPGVFAFIDDDETAEADWLSRSVAALREFDADVAQGRAEPAFVDGEPAGWVVRGGFFRLPRYAHGAELRVAFTNNVAFRRRVLEALRPMFDESLGMTGADDSEAFMRAWRSGFRIVWADDAVTHEWTPASRARARWVWQRGYRVGNSMALLAWKFDGWRGRARGLGIGVYRIGKGSFFLPILGPWRKELGVLYVRHVCYGAGAVMGAFGRAYGEYRKVHGR